MWIGCRKVIVGGGWLENGRKSYRRRRGRGRRGYKSP
jgi:hypothetical protein